MQATQLQAERIDWEHLNMKQFMQFSQQKKLLESRQLISDIYKMIGFKILARDIKVEQDISLLRGYVIILFKHGQAKPKYRISKKLWEAGLDFLFAEDMG